MARLIVVTGTPGVGKTVLAKDLALRLDFQFVDIGEMAKQGQMFRGYDRARMSHLVDERRVRSALKQTLRSDGVLASHFVGGLLAEVPHGQAVVLRLDPVVLWNRLRSRGWSRRKAWENVEAELLDVCYCDAVKALGRARVFEIDATGKSRRRVLTESLKIVRSRKKNPSKRVSWLGRYDPILLSRRLHSG